MSFQTSLVEYGSDEVQQKIVFDEFQQNIQQKLSQIKKLIDFTNNQRVQNQQFTYIKPYIEMTDIDEYNLDNLKMFNNKYILNWLIKNQHINDIDYQLKVRLIYGKSEHDGYDTYTHTHKHKIYINKYLFLCQYNTECIKILLMNGIQMNGRDIQQIYDLKKYDGNCNQKYYLYNNEYILLLCKTAFEFLQRKDINILQINKETDFPFYRPDSLSHRGLYRPKHYVITLEHCETMIKKDLKNFVDNMFLHFVQFIYLINNCSYIYDIFRNQVIFQNNAKKCFYMKYMIRCEKILKQCYQYILKNFDKEKILDLFNIFHRNLSNILIAGRYKNLFDTHSQRCEYKSFQQDIDFKKLKQFYKMNYIYIFEQLKLKTNEQQQYEIIKTYMEHNTQGTYIYICSDKDFQKLFKMFQDNKLIKQFWFKTFTRQIQELHIHTVSQGIDVNDYSDINEKIKQISSDIDFYIRQQDLNEECLLTKRTFQQMFYLLNLSTYLNERRCWNRNDDIHFSFELIVLKRVIEYYQEKFPKGNFQFDFSIYNSFKFINEEHYLLLKNNDLLNETNLTSYHYTNIKPKSEQSVIPQHKLNITSIRNLFGLTNVRMFPNNENDIECEIYRNLHLYNLTDEDLLQREFDQNTYYHICGINYETMIDDFKQIDRSKFNPQNIECETLNHVISLYMIITCCFKEHYETFLYNMIIQELTHQQILFMLYYTLYDKELFIILVRYLKLNDMFHTQYVKYLLGILITQDQYIKQEETNEQYTKIYNNFYEVKYIFYGTENTNENNNQYYEQFIQILLKEKFLPYYHKKYFERDQIERNWEDDTQPQETEETQTIQQIDYISCKWSNKSYLFKHFVQQIKTDKSFFKYILNKHDLLTLFKYNHQLYALFEDSKHILKYLITQGYKIDMDTYITKNILNGIKENCDTKQLLYILKNNLYRNKKYVLKIIIQTIFRRNTLIRFQNTVIQLMAHPKYGFVAQKMLNELYEC